MVQTTARWPPARVLRVFSRCSAVVESSPDVGSACHKALSAELHSSKPCS